MFPRSPNWNTLVACAGVLKRKTQWVGCAGKDVQSMGAPDSTHRHPHKPHGIVVIVASSRQRHIDGGVARFPLSLTNYRSSGKSTYILYVFNIPHTVILQHQRTPHIYASTFLPVTSPFLPSFLALRSSAGTNTISSHDLEIGTSRVSRSYLLLMAKQVTCHMRTFRGLICVSKSPRSTHSLRREGFLSDARGDSLYPSAVAAPPPPLSGNAVGFGACCHQVQNCALPDSQG